MRVPYTAQLLLHASLAQGAMAPTAFAATPHVMSQESAQLDPPIQTKPPAETASKRSIWDILGPSLFMIGAVWRRGDDPKVLQEKMSAAREQMTVLLSALQEFHPIDINAEGEHPFSLLPQEILEKILQTREDLHDVFKDLNIPYEASDPTSIEDISDYRFRLSWIKERMALEPLQEDDPEKLVEQGIDLLQTFDWLLAYYHYAVDQITAEYKVKLIAGYQPMEILDANPNFQPKQSVEVIPNNIVGSSEKTRELHTETLVVNENLVAYRTSEGMDPLKLCSDYGGVVMDPETGQVLGFAVADGVGGSECPSSTAQILVKSALRRMRIQDFDNVDAKVLIDVMLHAEAVAKSSLDRVALLEELHEQANQAEFNWFRRNLGRRILERFLCEADDLSTIPEHLLPYIAQAFVRGEKIEDLPREKLSRDLSRRLLRGGEFSRKAVTPNKFDGIGSSTLQLATIHNGVLHHAIYGDGGTIVLRRNKPSIILGNEEAGAPPQINVGHRKMNPANVKQSSVALEPGDVILAFTDGILKRYHTLLEVLKRVRKLLDSGHTHQEVAKIIMDESGASDDRFVLMFEYEGKEEGKEKEFYLESFSAGEDLVAFRASKNSWHLQNFEDFGGILFNPETGKIRSFAAADDVYTIIIKKNGQIKTQATKLEPGDIAIGFTDGLLKPNKTLSELARRAHILLGIGVPLKITLQTLMAEAGDMDDRFVVGFRYHSAMIDQQSDVTEQSREERRMLWSELFDGKAALRGAPSGMLRRHPFTGGTIGSINKTGKGLGSAVQTLLPRTLLLRLVEEKRKPVTPLKFGGRSHGGGLEGQHYNPWKNQLGFGEYSFVFPHEVGHLVFMRWLVKDHERIDIDRFWKGHHGHAIPIKDSENPELVRVYQKLVGAFSPQALTDDGLGWGNSLNENFAHNVERLTYGAPFIVAPNCEATTEDILKYFIRVGLITKEEAGDYLKRSFIMNGGEAVEPIKSPTSFHVETEFVQDAYFQEKYLREMERLGVQTLTLEIEVAVRLGESVDDVKTWMRQDPQKMIDYLKFMKVNTAEIEQRIKAKYNNL